jgi:hypothetical protein
MRLNTLLWILSTFYVAYVIGMFVICLAFRRLCVWMLWLSTPGGVNIYSILHARFYLLLILHFLCTFKVSVNCFRRITARVILSGVEVCGQYF